MKKIIPIIKLAADFASVCRATGYREGHFENDAEHSYQLAMACWSANKQYNLKLKDELILKFALIHDLVEVYAGDIDAQGDKLKIESKKKREAQAFKDLKNNYKQYQEIIKTIQRYEKKKDVEAQLVYVMDKFIPDVNVYESKGDYYCSRKVDVEKWQQWLFGKINYQSLSPKLKPLVDESINEVKNKLGKIFYKGR